MTTPTTSRTPTEIAVDALLDKAVDWADEKMSWYLAQHPDNPSQATPDGDPTPPAKEPTFILAVRDSLLDDIKVKLITKKKWSYKFPGDKYQTKFALKWIDGENKVYAYDPQYKQGREVVTNTVAQAMFQDKDFKIGSLKALLSVVAQECNIDDPLEFAGAFHLHMKSLYKGNQPQKALVEHYFSMITALKFAELSDTKLILSNFPQIAIGTNTKEAGMTLLPLIKCALAKNS